MTTHPLGYFVIRDMGLVKVYSCTKFEVSGFTNYKFTKGVLKCNNSALGP